MLDAFETNVKSKPITYQDFVWATDCILDEKINRLIYEITIILAIICGAIAWLDPLDKKLHKNS